MENKRLMIFAIAVVALVLLAGFSYILLNQEPEPTTAVVVILSPNEIGPDWHGRIYSEINDPNATSESTRFYRASWGANQSLMPPIEIRIAVYNSTSLCKSVFNQGVSEIVNSGSSYNYTNISMGDGGILFSPLINPYYIIEFYVQNVACIMHTDFLPFSQTWWYGTLVYFATLQAEKIDQYLAQHPGAS
jgi:hypothetical protein